MVSRRVDHPPPNPIFDLRGDNTPQFYRNRDLELQIIYLYDWPRLLALDTNLGDTNTEHLPEDA